VVTEAVPEAVPEAGNELLAALRRIPLFAHLDQEDPGCREFLEQGRQLRFGPAERIAAEGDPAAFFVLLGGEIQVKRQVDGRDLIFNDPEERRFFGDLPLLLGVPFFASIDSVTPCHVFRLDEDAFWQMLAHCRTVTREVLHAMARRLKAIEAVSQQQGQLASLGAMAAGLAHELNNPAAAARRAAVELRGAVREVQDAACLLGKGELSGVGRAFIVKLQAKLAGSSDCPTELDPIEQSDREELIIEWLEARGVPNAWEAAPALARAGFDEAALAKLEELVPSAELPLGVRWIERCLATLFLLRDLEKSVERVGDVVRAVSSYSYMDQAPQQDVNIHAGLDDTVTIMGYRLRGVKVVKEYDPAVPRLYAYGSELNQVWTNLIDNAVDAVDGVDGGGEIRIRTNLQDDAIVVEFSDNGPGIPEAVRKRLFEPFFTTKGIGKGTGIGLLTSRRIVSGRHGGEILAESRPGETRFTVRLPLQAPASTHTQDESSETPAPSPPVVPAASSSPPDRPVEEGLTETLKALRTVPLLAPMIAEGGAIRGVLEEGRELRLQAGEPLGQEGEAPFFSVIVDGEVRVAKRLGGQEVTFGTHGAGAFFGEIPILLGGPFVGSVYATKPSRVFRFEVETFWKIIAVCPKAARLVLTTLAERLRLMTSVAQQQEKLSSLGTLSAGLAHELNNPSAAARRAASHLRSAVLSQQSFICHLGTADLTPEQRETLERLGLEASRPEVSGAQDPLARSDGEAALAARLQQLGLADAWELAPAMAAAGLTTEWIEEVFAALPAAVVPDVLRWVERTIAVDTLLGEVENSTTRIANLVKAVKSYSHTGGAQESEIDLHASLDDALAVLTSKLKTVRVQRDYAADLPRIAGYPGELAQVWLNLLDNAASALDGQGEVRIRTAREQGQVLVEIRDSGPGIPPEITRRIWEPFFTTKPVGEGTGLGLVTVRRIVAGRHQGDISVRSTPGDTRFQVRLPLRGIDPSEGR